MGLYHSETHTIHSQILNFRAHQGIICWPHFGMTSILWKVEQYHMKHFSQAIS